MTDRILDPRKDVVTTTCVKRVQEIEVEDPAPIDRPESKGGDEYHRRFFVHTHSGLVILVLTGKTADTLRCKKRVKA